MSQTRYTPEKLGYKLFWEDQFNGDKLDTNKWEVRGVGARAVGFVSPEAVKVEDGFLKLSAFVKDNKILISAVGTQNHFMISRHSCLKADNFLKITTSKHYVTTNKLKGYSLIQKAISIRLRAPGYENTPS